MKNNLLILILITIVFTGCSEPEIDMKAKPKIQIAKTIKVATRKKGALYSNRGSSLFSDKKDLQIGDIIQIIVQETLTNNSKGTRSLSKTNDSALGGGILASANGGTLTTGANKFNTNVGLNFKTNTANSFSGSASSVVNEKFTTKLSVIIEETYQNGNYFVKGSKEMLIDGQKQVMNISGIIRPYDITPENTIYSDQLANLKISYEKEGEENNENHKSWGTKTIETIWPF